MFSGAISAILASAFYVVVFTIRDAPWSLEPVLSWDLQLSLLLWRREAAVSLGVAVLRAMLLLGRRPVLEVVPLATAFGLPFSAFLEGRLPDVAALGVVLALTLTSLGGVLVVLLVVLLALGFSTSFWWPIVGGAIVVGGELVGPPKAVFLDFL